MPSPIEWPHQISPSSDSGTVPTLFFRGGWSNLLVFCCNNCWIHFWLTIFLVFVLFLVQVEMTGSSIFDYCHAGDHEEIAEQLGLSLTGPSGLTSPSSAVGSDEGTGSQGTCPIHFPPLLRKSRCLLIAIKLWPSPSPLSVHSCRHNDFELDERLQGLRPRFLHPHEVHFDETWMPLQVIWIQGKCTAQLMCLAINPVLSCVISFPSNCNI